MLIHSRFKEYSVDFINSFEKVEELAKDKTTYFVVDNVVYNLYRQQLPNFDNDRLYLLHAVEVNKTIDTVLSICEKMTEMVSKRNTHLVSIGGGITQDITGFVATNLYRGIKWTFFPTTLLAACDSCIGGKSSLNYKGFKNLLGSFYPPDAIYILPNVFKTLSTKDYCSGLGEVVKFNIIAGDNGLGKIEQTIDCLLNHDYKVLSEFIVSSLKFKKKFIEEDEFDKGIRVLLNFAHTFGHAFEVASNYEIPHGSAVALGMITANDISVQRGFIDTAYAKRIENVCEKILSNVALKKEWFELDNIVTAIKKDKKQTDNIIKAVLIDSNHKLGVYGDIKATEIQKGLEHLLQVF